MTCCFFFSSRRRHTRYWRDWSSDVCSSNLALLTRRGRLRPGEVVTALAPVAAALAHAHERGVVHGDLSPGNVVFTAEGRPVLTDLGVARVLGEEAAREVTPAYVDPTVARGGAPGPASDVFGVAAAAFHALTEIAPWNAATPADTLRVAAEGDRKSTRLNSSHANISYAVFCLKK